MMQFTVERLKYLMIIVLSFTLFTFSSFAYPSKANAAFRFVAWADTKGDRNVLRDLSPQVLDLNPKFTVFPGDLGDSWSTNNIDGWICVMNGNTWDNNNHTCTIKNNTHMMDITFPTRGNHDSGASQSSWSSYFNQSDKATHVGASNYSELTKDMTYSFDIGKEARIIGIDVLGSVGSMSSASIAWLDQRLTDAENNNITHAFLYWHGPIYPMDGHCCTVAKPELIDILNKHPIVSATFHGHEHIVTYVHIDSSRIPGVTHEFEQVISGDAGAGPSSVQSARADYYINFGGADVGGFVTVDVNGPSFTLNYYKGGTTSSQKTFTFTKSGATPPPSTCNTCYNFNSSGSVDVQDILFVANRWGFTSSNPGYSVTYDIFCNSSTPPDGNINILDLQTVANNWGASSCTP